MGRTIHVTVHSAEGLTNADAAEGGQSDPFVVVCFDGNVSQELARTETVSNSSSPEWEQSFDLDVTSAIQNVIDETGEEPQNFTFCVYDGDVSEAEPLGMASLDFSDLVKAGKFSGPLTVDGGDGSINVTVEMKRVKIGSMLKDNAALSIAGGVAGVAALGALSAYLYKRYEKKKEKLAEDENVDSTRTGIVYGANIDDDGDDEEDKDNFKKWWEMDDEEDDDDDENRWGQVEQAY